MTNNLKLQNDLERLISIMPQKVVSGLSLDSLQDVIEIVLDIGRPAEIRHAGGKIDKIGSDLISEDDINFVTSHLQAHGVAQWDTTERLALSSILY